MRIILPILLCAAAFLATGAAARRAPGFALMDTTGAWHDLADYRGKPVLLAFIQSTCPHCAAFAENLQRAREKFGDRVAIIAVMDPPDSPDKAKAFIAGHRITYPIVFDMGQMAFSYVRAPSLQYPRLFVIDASGMIEADDQYSPLTSDIFDGKGLEQVITRMLNGDARKAAYYGR